MKDSKERLIKSLKLSREFLRQDAPMPSEAYCTLIMRNQIAIMNALTDILREEKDKE